MPVYEFRCRSCQAAFERLVRSMSSDEKVTCPSCGGADLERAFSVFAAHEGAGSSAAPAGGCDGCEAANGACPFGGQME